MEYIVTLVETTSHVVVVQSDDDIGLEMKARAQWIEGTAVDSNPRLEHLEVIDITPVPEEFVA